MNKLLITIFICIIVLIVYFIGVNMIKEEILKEEEMNRNIVVKQQFQGIGEAIGIGEKVSVLVVRPRWYGKIIETSDNNGRISTLYLFWNLPIPLETKGFNWRVYHWSIIVTIILIVIIVSLITILQKIDKREENIDGNYIDERGLEEIWELQN